MVVAPDTPPADRAMPSDSRKVALDDNGFDPNDYDWIPVKRGRRADGWHDSKQRTFIETLADTASVTEAARAVGMTTTSCYRLRRSPGAESFARAWDAALHAASSRLIEVAFDRALNGVEHIIFDKDGRRVGCQRRYSDRLLLHLIRAHHPALYGRSHDPHAPAPAAQPAVAEALAALTPATPPDPHLLMSPERLECELTVADLAEGTLPHWHRDPDPDPEPYVDAAFEAKLQACLAEGAAQREAEAAERAADLDDLDDDEYDDDDLADDVEDDDVADDDGEHDGRGEDDLEDLDATG